MEELDFTDKYNTELTPAQEKKFISWAEKNNKLEDLFDYDLRGFWKNKEEFSDNGHGSDMYKKPNHPTFSDQSIYHGVDNNFGGRWFQNEQGTVYIPSPTSMWNPAELQNYFSKYEPGVSLVFPPMQQEANPQYQDPFGDTTK